MPIFDISILFKFCQYCITVSRCYGNISIYCCISSTWFKKVVLKELNDNIFTLIVSLYPSTGAVLMLEEDIATSSRLMLALSVHLEPQFMKLVMQLAFGMSRVVQTEINMSPFMHRTFDLEVNTILRRKIKVTSTHWEFHMISVASCIIIMVVFL